MNTEKMGAGRDKREVHRGARVPGKVKTIEHWVGRGSTRADAGGWMLGWIWRLGGLCAGTGG
jgi:hypothetical protein